VRNFVSLAGDPKLLQEFRYAAIGPITAKTAAELSLPVVLMPDRATVPELAAAIERHFR
jgi:uroporphyrinogen-III synthase